MKYLSTIKNPIAKFSIGATLMTGLYVAITFFHIDDYMMYGTWLAMGWLAPLFGPASRGLAFLQQPLSVIPVFAPALIIGLLLALAKQRYAFGIAFMSTMVAYILTKLADAYQLHMWNAAVIVPAATMLVGYGLAYLFVRWVRRAAIIWPLVIVLAAVNLVVVPSMVNAIGRPIAEAKRTNELQSAAQNMPFTPYYPTYTPAGLQATPAKLEGYHDAAFQHKRVSYEVGKLEVMISEKLKNQDLVFNKTDNCDISTIRFTMTSKAEIIQQKIDASRDNLSICRLLGKTDDGHEVYVEANKSQFEFYYMEVDGTIIVMEHDKLMRPRYTSDFEQEVLKVFNGMKVLDLSKLTAGY